MVVELNQIKKTFSGGVEAIRSLDLQLKEGQVLGLFGHNGAGKTTTIKLILGLISATSGEIKVMGKRPDTHPEIKEHMGFLPENVQFYEQLSGREVLHYFAKLKRQTKRHGDDLLDRFQLEHAADRKVKTYSKGMRQRLGLAQAMLGEPKLLLLDEPTVGLDPVATKQFYQQVAHLQSLGCTLIICSHVLPGIESYINRALIMNKGQALIQGSLDELNQDANLPIQIQVQADQIPAKIEGEISRIQIANQWQIQVEAQQQVSAMQELSQLSGLSTLLAKSASLEDLYHFYQGLGKRHSQTSSVATEGVLA
jgi:Cu-processing system ATP-binding protein